jgi:hypothetical protein
MEREIALTLGGSWVDCDRVIKVAFRCCHTFTTSLRNQASYLFSLTPHFDSDGKTLKEFVTTHADNMDANDTFFVPDDYKLEQRGFLVLLGNHREVEGTE